jgi:hypothetical protein
MFETFDKTWKLCHEAQMVAQLRVGLTASRRHDLET